MVDTFRIYTPIFSQGDQRSGVERKKRDKGNHAVNKSTSWDDIKMQSQAWEHQNIWETTKQPSGCFRLDLFEEVSVT